MRKFLLALFITFSLGSGQALAGSGHSHGPDGGHKPHGTASEATVIKRATKVKNNLAKKGTIDSSWQDSQYASIEQKTYDKGLEWVVTFTNNKVNDKKKQTLYIFYSLDGHYIAANYTGN